MSELTNQKTMTVKEISNILGVSSEAIKKWVRQLYPDLIKNGIQTRLNQSQMTLIKSKLRPTTKVAAVTTDIEMQQKTIEVMQYWTDMYNKTKKELELKENQVNRLIHSSKLYVATEIAKELGFKSAYSFNKWLEIKEVQYKVNKTWVLTAQYSDCDYVSIKQYENEYGHIVYDRRWTGKGRDFILELFGDDK